MIRALAILLLCQLAGTVLQQALGLPMPGPVLGFVLLVAVFLYRGGPGVELRETSQGLLKHMGLLFVPAGVGIIAEAPLLREEWLPILAALIGSTVLSIAVTGAVMHWTMRSSGTSKSTAGTLRALGRGPS